MMATMAAETPTRANESDAWRAVEQRDARYDGRFVYAVRSTRVYCRPSCPSRRPLRANVVIFDEPDQAEHAGFRACLRCRPSGERVEPAGERAVGRARAYLDAHAGEPVSLRALATHAGMSAHHLQRSFTRLVGVSPKEYQDALRVSAFKSRLRAGDTVSRATYEAGYGSSSRVYERSDELLGMTPAAYRRGGAGMRITYAIVDSTLGRLLVGTTDRGVCAVAIGRSDATLERELRADFPSAEIARANARSHEWIRAVVDRIRNPQRSMPEIPLDVNGTAFQRRVWKALLEIPRGETRSYREVAVSIGQPSASRAVARACATNHIAVVIPCHRVVRGDGDVSGYRWGVERKRALLDREAE